MSDSRARGWCFTINNYTELDEHVVFEMAQYAKYVVCGRENGSENGTPHLQGFVYFDTLKSFKQVKEIHQLLIGKQMRGTVDQAAEYCKKKVIGSRQELSLNQSEKGERGNQLSQNVGLLLKLENTNSSLRKPQNLQVHTCNVSSCRRPRCPR